MVAKQGVLVEAAELPARKPQLPDSGHPTTVFIVVVASNQRPYKGKDQAIWNPSPNSTFGWDGDY